MAERRPLILVVEDEPRSQMLMRAILEPAGYDLVMVGNVADARIAVEEKRPALVLLDLRLPDEPGLVLARMLKSTRSTRSIPIIAVTAGVLEADRRSALAAGCDVFIEKPISPDNLLAEVRHWTRHSPGRSGDRSGSGGAAKGGPPGGGVANDGASNGGRSGR